MTSKTASYNGLELARTSDAVLITGTHPEHPNNEEHYFPPADIQSRFFKPSAANLSTFCPWKGHASYYDLHLEDGTVIADGAWTYREPFEKAAHIRDYVAFYRSKGIKVE